MCKRILLQPNVFKETFMNELIIKHLSAPILTTGISMRIGGEQKKTTQITYENGKGERMTHKYKN